MSSEKRTTFAFFSEPKGVGDLKTKYIIELKEMLNRQNNLLANKSLIIKLIDKGEKVRKIRDQIAEEIQSRENKDNSLYLEPTTKNSTVWEWRDKSKADKSTDVETKEKDALQLLSENGQIPTNTHSKSHMQRLIDKEKDPHFTYKPHNPVVADKVKKVIPEAHTELQGPISVKSLHLEESLELLTEQVSALKILSKSARRKRVDEIIEDRLEESAGDIVEQELEEETTDETETTSSINVNVQISTTY